MYTCTNSNSTRPGREKEKGKLVARNRVDYTHRSIRRNCSFDRYDSSLKFHTHSDNTRVERSSDARPIEGYRPPSSRARLCSCRFFFPRNNNTRYVLILPQSPDSDCKNN